MKPLQAVPAPHKRWTCAMRACAMRMALKYRTACGPHECIGSTQERLLHTNQRSSRRGAGRLSTRRTCRYAVLATSRGDAALNSIRDAAGSGRNRGAHRTLGQSRRCHIVCGTNRAYLNRTVGTGCFVASVAGQQRSAQGMVCSLYRDEGGQPALQAVHDVAPERVRGSLGN